MWSKTEIKTVSNTKAILYWAYCALAKLGGWYNRKQTDSGLPKPITADKWSAEEKVAVVTETLTLTFTFTEIELSQYCRAKGLYPEQVNFWKQACIVGNTKINNGQPAASAEHKADKKCIKSLECELNRKEKALAKTAVLLLLRKKFNAYWEDKGKINHAGRESKGGQLDSLDRIV
jgi:transposase